MKNFTTEIKHGDSHKRMNTFRIGYKSFYRETSDHHSDYIEADNRIAALKVFAKEHKIPKASRQQPDKWKWWDGEWLYEFRVVEPVKIIPCPHCSGKGEITAFENEPSAKK